MKGRESGMPEEDHWSSFFNPEVIPDRLLPMETRTGNLVEFGAGYGTFTLPAARRVTGKVTALDIEPAMIALVRDKAADEGLVNVEASVRDFVAEGTGFADGLQQHAMIYNLLHIENRVTLLREARRVLAVGGSLSVIHWRSDIPALRGPSLEIRPTADQRRFWMGDAGFASIASADIGDISPYHFGLFAYREGDPRL